MTEPAPVPFARDKTVFLTKLKKRISRNGNAILSVNGGTGSGKSYACIDIALDVSSIHNTPFSIEKNVAFNFKDLLKLMLLPENSNPGTVFILEEVGSVGSGAASREWQSKANAFFFSFLQTSRHKNQILILNCPSFAYLEKGARELVHFQLESLYIDYNAKKSVFRPYYLQVNTRTSKIYFKFIRYNNNGVRTKLTKVRFNLPPKEILKVYEKKKTDFTTQLNQNIMEEGKPKLGKAEEKRQKRIETGVFSMFKEGRTAVEIARIFEMPISTIKEYKNMYNAQKPKENLTFAK